MSTLTVPSAEASPEVAVTRPARRGARPRITLPIFHLPPSPASPSPNVMLQRPRVAAAAGLSPIHSPMINVPVTPGAAGAIPIGNPAGPFGLMQLYPTKASEFMFKQFEGFKDFTMNTAKSGLSVGEKIAFWLYNKVRSWSKRWFTHMFLFMVVLTYSVLGALLFVAVEGTHEEIAMKDLRKERYALIHDLRNLEKQQYLLDDDKAWDSEALKRLRVFEDHLYEQFKHGLSDSEKKVWSFWNAVFYCGTIYTTIGYGHISPSTTTGRAITIVYAIFGIPLFLILLADFGKLFTRGIKFLWAFVRRLYYTGSCKRVRRTAPVQEVWKGVQLVYDFATFRRPSQIPPGEGAVTEEDEEASVPLQQPQPQQQQQIQQVQQQQQQQPQHDNLQTVLPIDGLEPGTPAPSAFEVDDEFNLPISIAIFILLAYIFVGASVYFVWEEWGFFESFYFVFISMSTIGFGDFVPQHPMYMMASIVYLVFGLALTSMCINVVQIKLSDSFRQASAKLGATIGLRMAEEEGALTPSPVVEVTDVQPTITKSLSS